MRKISETMVHQLLAIDWETEQYGRATNGVIYAVPRIGDVVLQYRSIHRLADLGLVTWTAHSREVSVYQGHWFGRRGGTRQHLESWLETRLTPEGRAVVERAKWRMENRGS